MKLKILVKLIEMILGKAYAADEPRADMYLPERAFAMCLVYLAFGSACALWFLISHAMWSVICSILFLGLGITLLMCWKNQSIKIISDEEFTYTTMFGKSTTYKFSDIQGLRKNRDSLTMFVAGKKLHIEAMAILSERLIELINRELKRIHE